MNLVDIVIAEVPVVMPCRQCGKDLEALVRPEVVWCVHAEELCANPCGYRAKEPPGGEAVKCPWRTEVVGLEQRGKNG